MTFKELGLNRESLKDKGGVEFYPVQKSFAKVSGKISDAELEEMCRANGLSVDEVDKERILTFRGSDETPDRDGDIIRSSGWNLKEYRKNPVFLNGHDYRRAPLGRTLKVWVDAATKSLMFRVWFPLDENNPEINSVFSLYKNGVLNAVSVGFRATKVYRPDTEEERKRMGLGQHGVEIKAATLWELSAVTVPSNSNALRVKNAEQLEACKQIGIEAEIKEDADMDEIKELLLEIREDLKKSLMTKQPEEDDHGNDGGEPEVEALSDVELKDALKSIAGMFNNTKRGE